MARRRRRSLGVLFAVLAAGFCGLAIWAGFAHQWIIAAAAGAIALWFSDSAYRTL